MMMTTMLNVILTSSTRNPFMTTTYTTPRHTASPGSTSRVTSWTSAPRCSRHWNAPNGYTPGRCDPRCPGLDESQFRHARDSATAYHVDARAFSDLIDSLVADLDLLDSYTLVVMNPRRANMGAKYGYREGFSDDEVEFLRGKRTELLREAKRRGGVRARAPAPTAPPRSTYTEYFRSVGRRKFGNDDRRKAGDAWARKAGKRLDAQEKVRLFLFLRTGN
jgi:hypothetical protein